MGRDKSRLRFGTTTMLGHIRKTARATALPVRVIRRDLVFKCGPLGGIYTALKTTKADAVLFLSCDMPLVSTELIQFVLQEFGNRSRVKKTALFVRLRELGFPFVIRRTAVEIARQQIEKADFSLQSLAKVLKATILRLAKPFSRQLFNVNTPAEWAILQASKRHVRGKSGGLHFE